MSEQCLVSVLVPIYNVERYLRECLNSLISQTLEDIEIICIDDGSTDGSLDIVREFQSRDARIKVITKPNSGYGNSMNRGLDAATGKYIGIVESDDFAETTMFENMVALAEANNADVVKTNFFTHLTDTDPNLDPVTENLIGCTYGSVFNPSYDQSIFLTQPAIWSALYNHQFLVENHIRFLETPGASFQDTSFNYKVFALAHRVVVDDKAYLHYRIDNSNSSVKALSKVFCICDEYEEMWKFTAEDPKRMEALGKRLPQIQAGGYFWNLERLTPALRPQFYQRLVSAFQQINENGLLDRSYFDDVMWERVQAMLADPDDYYYKTYGPTNIDTTVILSVGVEAVPGFKALGDGVISALGQNDELIIAFPDEEGQAPTKHNAIDIVYARQARKALDKLQACDSRVYNADDLWRCEAWQEIDLSRIRGKRVICIEVDDVLAGRDLSAFTQWLAVNLSNLLTTLSTTPSTSLLDGASTMSSLFTAEDVSTCRAYAMQTAALEHEVYTPVLLPLLVRGFYADNLNAQTIQIRFDKQFRELFNRNAERTLTEFKNAKNTFTALGEFLFEPWKQYREDKLVYLQCIPEEERAVIKARAQAIYAPLWSILLGWYHGLTYNDRIILQEQPQATDCIALVYLKEQANNQPASAIPDVSHPDISVIIPVYNAKNYLWSCLESVLCQNEISLEVICVVDDSPDDSIATLEEIAHIDHRVTIVYQPNGGAGAARNRGIGLAQGDYLAFIDPDDYYPNDTVLAHLYQTAIEQNVAMCGGSFVAFYPDGTKKECYVGDEVSYTIREAGMRTMEQDQFDYGWIRFIYQRKLFTEEGLHFPEYRWYEDPVFFVNAVQLVDGYYVIPEEAYCYREDYKEANWTAVVVRDMLKGLQHNLHYADKQGYDLLYSRLIHRIDFDYNLAIQELLDDEEVLQRMVTIQSNLNIDKVPYIKEQGFRVFTLRPLYDEICRKKKTAIVRLADKVEASKPYKTLQNVYEHMRS